VALDSDRREPVFMIISSSHGPASIFLRLLDRSWVQIASGKLELVVTWHDSRKHLPIITLKRAA
jgi:hypothetical protein